MPANPIGGVLKSLPIETMFAQPMMAAIDTHTAACMKYAEFIEKVGLNPDGTVKMVRFEYQETVMGEDGNPTEDKVQRVVDAPFFSLVPQPAFGVDKVTVDFELEVNTSESSSKETEAKASLSGSVGFAWWKVKFSGSVSHKSTQTRKTDTRAKYSVHMEGSRGETPEPMMRIIDAITNARTKPIQKDKAPEVKTEAAPA